MKQQTLDEFLVAYRFDNNAWWGLATSEMQRFFDAALERIEETNARLAEAHVILRALAEAERLEGIAIANLDAPDARSAWTSWQAQRIIASAALRGWQERYALPEA